MSPVQFADQRKKNERDKLFERSQLLTNEGLCLQILPLYFSVYFICLFAMYPALERKYFFFYLISTVTNIFHCIDVDLTVFLYLL